MVVDSVCIVDCGGNDVWNADTSDVSRVARMQSVVVSLIIFLYILIAFVFLYA